MECKINETLAYIIFLSRHISPDDLPHAIAIVLTDLNFESHLEGFEYLKDAIYIKCCCMKLRLNSIFLQIIQDNHQQVDSRQLEQTIRHAIKKAWILRDEASWSILIPQHQWKDRQPSNNVFISRIAFLMDLWLHCNKEPVEDIS